MVVRLDDLELVDLNREEDENLEEVDMDELV